jgi:hypothetical protein
MLNTSRLRTRIENPKQEEDGEASEKGENGEASEEGDGEKDSK